MNIDQQGGQDGHMNEAPGVQRVTITRIALEQSALYQARLAIARWSHSSSDAVRRAHLLTPKMAQAQWYEKRQQDFQEWLGRGGFAQHDVACIEAKMLHRTVAPHIALARAA